jgi:uncharacterized protein (TIGR02453 family)
MIQKETLEFLRLLRKNNDRAWFAANRALYDTAWWNVSDLTMELIDGIRAFDDSIGPLNSRDCIFRLVRDTRFAADKSPYKPNFGVFIKHGGRKLPGAGYYLHIEPGSCMLSGGIYMPPARELAAIRSSVAEDPQTLRSLLAQPRLADEFGHLWGDAVKTAPRGYAKDHPAIDLIRHKHYIVGKEILDEEILDPGFLSSCLDSFQVVRDFNRYLNMILENSISG